jgi:hypothetical protein
MVDQVVQDLSKICDDFQEMRKDMLNSTTYSGKMAATDKLYEAIRQFAYDIGLVPPYIPMPSDDY